MPVVHFDFDEKIRLWCHHTVLSHHLIITAHGEHTNLFSGRFSRSFFLPAGKRLRFYTANHTAMTDRSLMAIARQNQLEVEEGKYVGPRRTANYNLYHYERDLVSEMAPVCNNAVGHQYPDVLQILGADEGGPARGSSLAEVLSVLEGEAHDRYEAYREIHCSFCRVGYQWRAHTFD